MQENQTPVNQLPSQPVNQIEQTKPNNFLVILLSVLLFIAIGFAGFFAYQTQNLVKELQAIRSEELVTPTPLVSVEPTTDPTADWKTYTNTKFKYQFMFPSTWEYSRGPSNVSDIELGKQRDIDIFISNLPPGNPGVGITVKINELDALGNNKNCTTIDDCINKSFSWLPTTQEIERDESVFLGEKTKIIKYTRVTTSYSQTWEYLFVIINNNFYSFSLSSETGDFDKNQKVFDQILSTFKFVD